MLFEPLIFYHYVIDNRVVCIEFNELNRMSAVLSLQNWYRGMVQSVASDKKTASILYIDFGNEENVTMDMIKPLAASLELMPPCVSFRQEELCMLNPFCYFIK